MRTRLRLGLVIPSTILVFYMWLAIFLVGENAAYLPLSVQFSALNAWLGNVEWLLLYLWIVGFLYVTLGDKLNERRRKLKGWKLDTPSSAN